MEAWKFWTLRGGTLLGSAIRPGEIYRVLHEFADLTETEAALLESIVEGRRGQTTPIASLLTDLRSRE